MSELAALDGLNDVPWANLEHFWGRADDLPDLLRSLAAGDMDEDFSDRSSDFYELAANLWGGDDGYHSATIQAIPFLSRIAGSGTGAVGALRLLGCVAMDMDTRGPDDSPSAREAVAAQGDTLTRCLSNPEAEVRALTAWTLAESQSELALPALHSLWQTEPNSVVRATTLKALEMLDPRLAARIASRLLSEPSDSDSRLVAASIATAAGVPWSGELEAAATAWMDHGVLLPGWIGPEDDYKDPFHDLLMALASRGDALIAAGLVRTGLSRSSTAPAARDQLVQCARFLVLRYRVPVQPLAEALAAVAGDEACGLAATTLLRCLGNMPNGVADQVADVADTLGPSEHADIALAHLIVLGDPRAPGLLARDLRDRPIALAAAASELLRGGSGPPCDQELLDAARERLRAAETPWPPARELLALLRQWGPDAAAAIPDLLGVWRWSPSQVAATLTALGGMTREAAEMLKTAVETLPLTAGPAYERMELAVTLHAVLGDDEHLFSEIERGLGPGGDMRNAARAARTLPTAADRLVLALAAALAATASGGIKVEQARTQMARSLWHLAHDAGEVLSVVAEGIRPEGGATTLWACQAAAELGAAAKPLIPALLPVLDDPLGCPFALEALLRIDPETHGGVPLTVLAEKLADTIDGSAWAHTQLKAVAVLRDLGPGSMTPETAQRLRHLAEQSERIARDDDFCVVQSDEKIRAAIRELLKDHDALRSPATPDRQG